MIDSTFWAVVLAAFASGFSTCNLLYVLFRPCEEKEDGDQ